MLQLPPSSQKCTVEAGLGSLQIQRSAVVIGKLVWVDTGNGVKTAKASDYDFADQCPSDAGFWKQLDFDVASTIKGKPETKNGVKTEHVDPVTAVWLGHRKDLAPMKEGVAVPTGIWQQYMNSYLKDKPTIQF